MNQQDLPWTPDVASDGWDMGRPITVPQHQLPVARTDNAVRRGVERNLCFRTWGGIGDQICAEPTLRYALKMFKDCNFTLASELPELFKHLHPKFKRIFDLNEELPLYKNYLVFDTITAPDQSNLVWMFFSHLLVNCVDFPSLCALRQMLPIADKEIRLEGTLPDKAFSARQCVGGIAVHPGKHWQTKTFPREWWNKVLETILTNNFTPILIGGDADDNRSTVDVDATGCIDLRSKLTLSESIWVTQNVSVLLTNDSAPLHMAASGDAWIGFIATCKHPDMITHWRHGKWQWREENFGKGGIWELVDYCPNKNQNVEVERVDQKILESWLPSPVEFGEWAVAKANGHDN